MCSVKRSVSMYSLQNEYLRGDMDLPKIVDFLDEMGTEGIELISDQMLHNAPHVADEEIGMWNELIRTHRVKPVCNDIFINTCLYRNRTLTTRESTNLLIDELKLANRLGFNLVRLVSMTPPDIIEPALSYAEKYGVTMALEIHAGMSFDNPMTKAFIEVMKKVKSSYVGIVVDMGIFCKRIPRVSSNYFMALGANRDLIDYLDAAFAKAGDIKKFLASNGRKRPAEWQKLVKNESDEMYSLFADGYENTDLRALDEYLPYIKHFHGKIFEMMDDGQEYSISYSEIVKYLDGKGWDGYISTEYEGNRFTLPGQPTTEKEQVRLHQACLKKCIDSLK